MSCICPNFTPGKYDEQDAVIVNFTTEQGNKILRTTKEFSLTYVPETDEWFGDVIAYGSWLDLDSDEIRRLRSYYGLDEFMELYLTFLN